MFSVRCSTFDVFSYVPRPYSVCGGHFGLRLLSGHGFNCTPMPDTVSEKISDHLIKRCATAAPILLFHVFLHFVKLSAGDDYETEIGQTNEPLN
jgi:hypothetical protein